MSVMFLSLRYLTFLAYIPTLFFEASAPRNNNVRLKLDTIWSTSLKWLLRRKPYRYERPGALEVNQILFRCIAFAHFPGAMNTVGLGIITSMFIGSIHPSFPWFATEILNSFPRLAHLCYTLSTIMGSRCDRPSWHSKRGSSGSTQCISNAHCIYWRFALQQWSLTKVKTILFTIGAGALRTCVPAVLERSDNPLIIHMKLNWNFNGRNIQRSSWACTSSFLWQST